MLSWTKIGWSEALYLHVVETRNVIAKIAKSGLIRLSFLNNKELSSIDTRISMVEHRHKWTSGQKKHMAHIWQRIRESGPAPYIIRRKGTFTVDR